MTSALHSEAIYKSEDGLLRSDKVNRDQGSYQQDIPEWFKAYAERQDKILEQQNTILTQLAGKSSLLHPRSHIKRDHVFSVKKWDILKISAPRVLRVKSLGQLDP